MIKLSGFQVQEQKTSYTCGYSSLSMISYFLGSKVEEEELEKELPIGRLGAIPSKFIRLFKRYLPSYNIKLQFIHKDSFIEMVENQLEKGVPVPIICLAKNKFKSPVLVGHYLVIIGIDKLNSNLYVADPFYGYEREITFEEAYKDLSFIDDHKENTMMLYKFLRLVVKIMGFIAFKINKR